MSLQKILEEIKTIKPHAEEDVLEVPRETLNGRLARQRNAQNNLISLKENYAIEMLRTAVFILVSGPESDSFAAAATTNFGCFLAEKDTFYRDLASRVNATIYEGQEAGVNLFEVVGHHLEDKASELGILGYPQLLYRQDYRRVVNGIDELTTLLKQAVNDQVGSEVVGIQAVRSLVDTAIQAGYTKTVTPIVIKVDENEAEPLASSLRRLNPNVAVVSAPEGTTADQINDIMNSLRNRLLGRPVFQSKEMNVDEIVEEVAQNSKNKNRKK